jgi:hypothetical protein
MDPNLPPLNKPSAARRPTRAQRNQALEDEATQLLVEIQELNDAEADVAHQDVLQRLAAQRSASSAPPDASASTSPSAKPPAAT